MPWTIHLNGIAGIFLQDSNVDPQSEEAIELAALIGVLDLPTHTLGRQTKHLHIWHKYCLHKVGPEELTGIPCSLIHLLASAFEPDIEDRLLNWPNEHVDPLSGQLWNATQHGGLIMVREFRRDQGLPITHGENVVANSVKQIMANVRELRPKLDRNIAVNWDSLLFPLVAAGSQFKFLTYEDREIIKECVASLSTGAVTSWPYYRAAITVLETLWASDGTRSINQVTRDLGLELALF